MMIRSLVIISFIFITQFVVAQLSPFDIYLVGLDNQINDYHDFSVVIRTGKNIHKDQQFGLLNAEYNETNESWIPQNGNLVEFLSLTWTGSTIAKGTDIVIISDLQNLDKPFIIKDQNLNDITHFFEIKFKVELAQSFLGFENTSIYLYQGILLDQENHYTKLLGTILDGWHYGYDIEKYKALDIPIELISKDTYLGNLTGSISYFNPLGGDEKSPCCEDPKENTSTEIVGGKPMFFTGSSKLDFYSPKSYSIGNTTLGASSITLSGATALNSTKNECCEGILELEASGCELNVVYDPCEFGLQKTYTIIDKITNVVVYNGSGPIDGFNFPSTGSYVINIECNQSRNQQTPCSFETVIDADCEGCNRDIDVELDDDCIAHVSVTNCINPVINWYQQGSNTVLSTGSSFIPTSNGIYAYVVSGCNNCDDATGIIQVGCYDEPCDCPLSIDVDKCLATASHPCHQYQGLWYGSYSSGESLTLISGSTNNSIDLSLYPFSYFTYLYEDGNCKFSQEIEKPQICQDNCEDCDVAIALTTDCTNLYFTNNSLACHLLLTDPTQGYTPVYVFDDGISVDEGLNYNEFFDINPNEDGTYYIRYEKDGCDDILTNEIIVDCSPECGDCDNLQLIYDDENCTLSLSPDQNCLQILASLGFTIKYWYSPDPMTFLYSSEYVADDFFGNDIENGSYYIEYTHEECQLSQNTTNTILVDCNKCPSCIPEFGNIGSCPISMNCHQEYIDAQFDIVYKLNGQEISYDQFMSDAPGTGIFEVSYTSTTSATSNCSSINISQYYDCNCLPSNCGIELFLDNNSCTLSIEENNCGESLLNGHAGYTPTYFIDGQEQSGLSMMDIESNFLAANTNGLYKVVYSKVGCIDIEDELPVSCNPICTCTPTVYVDDCVLIIDDCGYNTNIYFNNASSPIASNVSHYNIDNGAGDGFYSVEFTSTDCAPQATWSQNINCACSCDTPPLFGFDNATCFLYNFGCNNYASNTYTDPQGTSVNSVSNNSEFYDVFASIVDQPGIHTMTWYNTQNNSCSPISISINVTQDQLDACAPDCDDDPENDATTQSCDYDLQIINPNNGESDRIALSLNTGSTQHNFIYNEETTSCTSSESNTFVLNNLSELALYKKINAKLDIGNGFGEGDYLTEINIWDAVNLIPYSLNLNPYDPNASLNGCAGNISINDLIFDGNSYNEYCENLEILIQNSICSQIDNSYLENSHYILNIESQLSLDGTEVRIYLIWTIRYDYNSGPWLGFSGFFDGYNGLNHTYRYLESYNNSEPFATTGAFVFEMLNDNQFSISNNLSCTSINENINISQMSNIVGSWHNFSANFVQGFSVINVVPNGFSQNRPINWNSPFPITCNEINLSVTNQCPDATNYVWSTGALTPSISVPQNSGEYTVTFDCPDGCTYEVCFDTDNPNGVCNPSTLQSTETNELSQQLTQREVEELDKHNIKISPNPSNRYFNLEIVHDAEEQSMLYIHDATGKVMQQNNLKLNHGITEHRIDASSHPPGLYFLQVETQDYQYPIQKLIIIK